MKVVMATEFLTHYELALGKAFLARANIDFTIVVNKPIAEEQLRLGFADLNQSHDCVLRPYENLFQRKEAVVCCQNCDLLIGSGPSEYANGRRHTDKLTFFSTERLFKEAGFSWKTIPRFVKYASKQNIFRGAYLLSIGRYAAADFAKTGNYLGKAYKWGYFPEVKPIAPAALLERKNREIPQLLWVGRMIGWKHPEAAIEVAERLKADGYKFKLDLIGGGELEKTLRAMIRDRDLGKYVSILGSMPPEQVREHMEKASIYLFPSDCNEGWGVVLSEAMGSACAVVASDKPGSSTYMMRNGENGLVFHSGDWDEMYESTKRLLDDPALRERCAVNAYRTVAETWNAEVAVGRLLELAACLKDGRDTPFLDGPCSRA